MATVDDGVIAQLEQAGAPEEVIQAARKRMQPPDDGCEVWEENWLSFRVFESLGTQWNVAVGMSGLYHAGINYLALPIVMRRYKVPHEDRDRVFDDIRLMERAAREVLNKR